MQVDSLARFGYGARGGFAFARKGSVGKSTNYMLMLMLMYCS